MPNLAPADPSQINGTGQSANGGSPPGDGNQGNPFNWAAQQGAIGTQQVQQATGVQQGGAGSVYQPTATPSALQTQLGAQSLATGSNGLGGPAGGYQNQLAQQLMNQSLGKGDSVAQEQFKQNTDSNLRQQAGLAASGRNPALASYNAMQNQGAAAQSAAGQTAIARLQEQYQSQAALSGLTNNMQSQGLQQAGLNQANSQFNAGQGNQLNVAQGQMNQNQNQFYNQLMTGQQQQQNQFQQNLALQKNGVAVQEANPQSWIPFLGQGASGVGSAITADSAASEA